MYDLSAAELEVAQFLAEGMTREEVAHRLTASEASIQAVIRKIRERTESRNITHAVALLVAERQVEVGAHERPIPLLPGDAGPAAVAIHKTLAKHASHMTWRDYRESVNMFGQVVQKGW